MAEQPEGVAVNAPDKASKSKTIVLSVTIIPLIAALSFFLVTKVINPRFAPEASAGSVDNQAVDHIKNVDDNDGFLFELGTVIVNPAGGRSIRIVKVGVSVEVMTKDLLKKVEALKTKLQHQLIITLSSKQIEKISSTEGKIALQDELRDIFSSELGAGPGEIRQVYFSEFIIQ